jgi:hypothetical protein
MEWYIIDSIKEDDKLIRKLCIKELHIRDKTIDITIEII